MRTTALLVTLFLLALVGLIWLNLSVQADITRVCREGGYSWTWRCTPLMPEPTVFDSPT